MPGPLMLPDRCGRCGGRVLRDATPPPPGMPPEPTLHDSPQECLRSLIELRSRLSRDRKRVFVRRSRRSLLDDAIFVVDREIAMCTTTSVTIPEGAL